MIRLFIFDCLFPLWGGQITTHVVLSVITLRLQGNSLYSSRRPPICYCPFVLNSIHRSGKDKSLWRFLSSVMRLTAWGMIKSSDVDSCSPVVCLSCIVIMNESTECGSTHLHAYWGSCRWRAHAADHQQSNQWWPIERDISSKRVLNLLETVSKENQVFDNLRERKLPKLGLFSQLKTCGPD